MNCRLCNSSELSIYYTQGIWDQFKFYKCNECKLVNLDMSEGIDQGKYSVEYIDPDNMQHKKNKDQLATYNFIKRNISKRGNYLDIGCGNGKLLQLAKADNWDVHGIELSQSFAEKIKERLDIDVTVVNFMDYQTEVKYDLLTLRHVLEHLPDPVLAMKKMNSFLNEGAYAELEFPNIEGLTFKVRRFLDKLGISKKKYEENYKPGHCHEFSKKSFNYLLSKTGFELVKWETYSSKKLTNLIYNAIPIGGKSRVIIKKQTEVV